MARELGHALEFRFEGNDWEELGEEGRADFMRLWGVFTKCANIFIARNKQRGGNWKDFGWDGCWQHMRSKASRIRMMFYGDGRQKDLDDAFDLVNYTAFFILNVEDDNEFGNDDLGW